MDEPSVLDYVKSKLFFWRGEVVEVPTTDAAPVEELPTASLEREPAGVSYPAVRPALRAGLLHWPGWKLLLPLVLALAAQRALEPPNRSLGFGVALYALAAAFWVALLLRGRVVLPLAAEPPLVEDDGRARLTPLIVGLTAALVAFLAFGGNRFDSLNLLLWGLSLFGVTAALWLPVRPLKQRWARLRLAIAAFFRRGLHLSPWTLLVLAVLALAAFFRFYQLRGVPPEMFSDHAEKLLDVADVLDGQYRIFFPRNTGREAFQMYLTAAMALLFDTGVSFLSLKLGTTLAGFFTLPFIYLLGKEIANRRAGLLAMAFAGIAYWPNVISRVALRFTLYPFFAAPTLYFLVRGLRRGQRNDFIWAGIFLGLGLHGYSPFRFVPFVVLLAVGLYWLHRRERPARRRALWGLTLLVLLSLLVFSPLLRYALSNWDSFTYRTMTRMGQVERPFPGPVWQIFLKNLWNAMTMFWWDDGEIWVHSVTHRPALDIISATLLLLGGVGVTVRYLRRRQWEDAFLLLSIPALMMPSILSLAFPAENPSLNRTGAAIIPVFLLVGIALDGWLTALRQSLPSPRWGTVLAWGIGILLLAGSSAQNYDLVFQQYRQSFAQGAWNTSELGAVIRTFADTIGEEDSAWVVPYPYWVDTRLVGIRAGFPRRDYALWPDQISLTLDDPRPKLFLFKPEDADALAELQRLYPQGAMKLYDSAREGKDFYMYFVPPER